MELFYSRNISGNSLTLGSEESIHCVKVLRKHAGDPIDVIDGLGNLYHCRLTEASSHGAAAEILGCESAWGGHPYRLTMAVCPTKNNERYEWFAEKAVEMGVDEIVPVIGEHSQRRAFKTDRLERIIVSAAKQSLKAAFPQVLQPISVHDFIASAPANTTKLIAYCFDGPKVSIREALAERPRDIIILIGPEGDFSPAEAAFAMEKGFRPVHLGPSRLRTETAAVSAVAAVYLNFI